MKARTLLLKAWLRVLGAWNRLPRWIRFPVGFYCWWVGRHRGGWELGEQFCVRCGFRTLAAPPPGAHICSEMGDAIYQVREDGALQRIDKFHGSKKERRRQKAKVAALKQMREQMLADSDV